MTTRKNKRKVRIGIEGLTVVEEDGNRYPCCVWVSHLAKFPDRDDVEKIVWDGEPGWFTTDSATYIAKFLLKNSNFNIHIYS